MVATSWTSERRERRGVDEDDDGNHDDDENDHEDDDEANDYDDEEGDIGRSLTQC